MYLPESRLNRFSRRLFSRTGSAFHTQKVRTSPSMRCDITRADIAVTNNTVICENGPPISLHSHIISINGSSPHHSITISNSQVTLEFADTEIHHAWPLICNGSDVTIVTTGGRTILSGEQQSPGISCINSNISFFTTDPTSLLEATNATHVGIGAAPNSTCNRLLFLNGTWRADEIEDGAGIGSASGDSGTSILKNLTILDGTFFSQGGSGIGAGASTERGDSIVNSLVIRGGSFFLTAGHGAALGSGRAEIGRSEIKTLVIYNGTFSCTTSWGSGIGSAFAVEGISTIGWLVIHSATIMAIGFGGFGGVGSASLYGRYSFVGEITIGNGSVNLDCTFEPSYADHSCISGDSVGISNATIHGRTEAVFIGKSLSTRWSQPLDMAIAYGARSGNEGLQAPFLHFAFLRLLDASLEYELHIENRTIKFTIFDGPGILLSVSRPGRYEVKFTTTNHSLNGSLCYGPNETTFFFVGNTEACFVEVHLCPVGYVRRSRTISPARSLSPMVTPIVSPAATTDVIDTGSLIAISIGIAAFLFAVFGVVILARCKNQCDRKSEQGVSLVRSEMMFTGNFGEPFAGTDESAA
jgi:hypothetical protein